MTKLYIAPYNFYKNNSEPLYHFFRINFMHASLKDNDYNDVRNTNRNIDTLYQNYIQNLSKATNKLLISHMFFLFNPPIKPTPLMYIPFIKVGREDTTIELIRSSRLGGVVPLSTLRAMDNCAASLEHIYYQHKRSIQYHLSVNNSSGRLVLDTLTRLDHSI